MEVLDIVLIVVFWWDDFFSERLLSIVFVWLVMVVILV